MIYVIGDSFTEGIELADHLLPNWEGYKDGVNKLSYDVEYFRKLNEIVTKDIFLFELEKNFRESNRWPTVLSNLLNYEVVNKGHAGKSIFNMVTMTSQDMADYKRQGKHVDLIIVQLTSLHRFQVPAVSFEPDGWKQGDYYQINPLMSRQQAEVFKANSYLDEYKKARYLLCDDNDFFYDYLNQILLLQTIAKFYTGKDVLIVRSIFDFTNEMNYAKLSDKTSLLYKLYELTEFEKFYHQVPSMMDIVRNNPGKYFLTRNDHVCHNTHKEFANLLADFIRNKKLI